MASRRTRTAGALAIAAVAALALWWFTPRSGTAPTFVRTADQNILLITIDALRADALGSAGGAAATPHLDRLAASGIRFTFAHAHAVATLPSHANILTGRYPFEHRVRDDAGFRLGPDPPTLAEVARAQGLATGAFVGSSLLDRGFGLSRGFDVYDGLTGVDERRAQEVVTAARLWIGTQEKPWFAWVHVFDPHAPYAPPAPFDREYADRRYAGEVAYTDAAIEPLLEIARRGARPTTVIVTADHGEGLGDHGEATHGASAYESTLRVPLIVAQVGGDARERRGKATSDAPVGHVDIMPTVADLLATGVAADAPGHSLLAADATRARAIYFEAMTPMLQRGAAPLRGTIVGDEKYIELGAPELYNLASDPRETRNLAANAGDRLRRLQARLGSFGDTTPGEQAVKDARARARLQEQATGRAVK